MSRCAACPDQATVGALCAECAHLVDHESLDLRERIAAHKAANAASLVAQGIRQSWARRKRRTMDPED